MRFAWMLAVMAALWVQPALAVTIITLDFEADTPGQAPAANPELLISGTATVRSGGPYGNYLELLPIVGPVPAYSMLYPPGAGGIQYYIASFDYRPKSETYFATYENDLITFAGQDWRHATFTFSPVVNVIGVFSDEGIEIDNIVLKSFGSGGIPEPSTWAMMILGFGLIGAAKRQCQDRQREGFRVVARLTRS
jgi:hypothetical protein